MKSFPSLGPTLPASNPPSLLEGMVILSDSLISSPEIEFADFKNKEIDEIFFSYNSPNNLYVYELVSVLVLLIRGN